ncbi:MAG: hypothetical protein IJ509_02695 [Bacilli bacterium]|nr:hypothetical protein [Bacilli bacterium]
MNYSKESNYAGTTKSRFNKLLKGLLIFLIVLLIGLIGCGIAYYKLIYSKNGIQTLLGYAFNYLEDNIDDYNSITSTFSIEMEIQSNDNSKKEWFNMFKELDLSGNFGIDCQEKIMSLDFETDFDNKDLIDGNVYVENDKGYIYLNELYSKYIEVDLSNNNQVFVQDNYKNIILSLVSVFNKSLKEEYLTKEKVELDSKKVMKSTLNLTGNNYQQFMTAMVNLLVNDEKFMESYCNITGMTVEDAKNSLNKKIDDKHGGYKFTLYTKGISFVQLDAVIDSNKLVIKQKDNKYSYEFYDNEERVFEGNVTVNKDRDKNTYLVSYYDNREDYGIEAIASGKVNLNGKVEKKEINNSIYYDELNYIDILGIYSKIMSNEGLVKILELVSSNWMNSFIN